MGVLLKRQLLARICQTLPRRRRKRSNEQHLLAPCERCQPAPSARGEHALSGARAQVYYNPKECSYEALLDCFFEHVDPTTKNRQGMDMGSQYRSGVYFHNEEQKAAAQKASTHLLERARWHARQQAPSQLPAQPGGPA